MAAVQVAADIVELVEVRESVMAVEANRAMVVVAMVAVRVAVEREVAILRR